MMILRASLGWVGSTTTSVLCTMQWRENAETPSKTASGVRLYTLKDFYLTKIYLSGLQDCIPTLRGDKTSRAQVLKKTGEYITHMQRKINDHQGEIKDLKSQNGQLESQIRALEKAKATGNYVNARAILETDSLLGGEDGDLSGLNSAEIIYDDTSSDASDSANAVTASLVTKAGVSPGPSLVSVSLPSVPGVSLSLPTMVSSGPSVPSVTSIQPGQSLLTSNRVQPGQSLLLSEPMRKKMKIASTSLI